MVRKERLELSRREALEPYMPNISSVSTNSTLHLHLEYTVLCFYDTGGCTSVHLLPLHQLELLSNWCRWGDSNSHALARHWNLNPACLPIPPLPRKHTKRLRTIKNGRATARFEPLNDPIIMTRWL